MELFITIITLIFILFLPRFFMSFIFFDFGKIDYLERSALALALSLCVVPLVVFYGSLLGFQISRVTVIAEILVILSITGGVLTFKEMRRHS